MNFVRADSRDHALLPVTLDAFEPRAAAELRGGLSLLTTPAPTKDPLTCPCIETDPRGTRGDLPVALRDRPRRTPLVVMKLKRPTMAARRGR